MYEGMFTQPGPDGIFGRDGVPEDPSSPTIDSDGEPLRETLVVAYPSPGHMRCARAILDRRTGHVEMQEEYREPTPDEVRLLAERGVSAGPGSVVQSVAQSASFGEAVLSPTLPPTLSPTLPRLPGPIMPPLPNPATGTPTAPAGGKKPRTWLKVGAAVVVGVAGIWAVNKWVVPMVKGEAPKRRRRAETREEE